MSGRILYDDILLKPVYNASVLVNGKPADIYGTTYLAFNVPTGEVIVEAHDSERQTTKETLTVEPGVVNSVDLILPGGEEGTPPDVTPTSDYLQFRWDNGLSLQLNLKNNEILGIGEIKINETPLRKPSLTGVPTIEKIENGKFVGIKNEKCEFIWNTFWKEKSINISKIISEALKSVYL